MVLSRVLRRKEVLKRVLSSPWSIVSSYLDMKYRIGKLRLTNRYMQPNEKLHLKYDWDVSAVLDGCRYDMLSEVNPFEEACEKHVSQGPSTAVWFYKNFTTAPDDLLEDVVYVSANAQASSRVVDPDRFHHFEEVFRYGWDDDIPTVPDRKGTVPADTVTDVALDLHQQYPDKRLLVHYIQPHNPFVDVDGEVPDEVGLAYGNLRAGEVPLDTVKTAERVNTEYVIEDVERLVKHVTGTVSITADHGNGWGEDGVYGHPNWGYVPATLEVPWIEVDGGEKTPPDSVFDVRPTDGDREYDLEQQLSDLGYR